MNNYINCLYYDYLNNIEDKYKYSLNKNIITNINYTNLTSKAL